MLTCFAISRSAAVAADAAVADVILQRMCMLQPTKSATCSTALPSNSIFAPMAIGRFIFQLISLQIAHDSIYIFLHIHTSSLLMDKHRQSLRGKQISIASNRWVECSFRSVHLPQSYAIGTFYRFFAAIFANQKAKRFKNKKSFSEVNSSFFLSTQLKSHDS